MDLLEIADAVVEHYGIDNQVHKLKEENLELADELKVYNGKITFELIDELADEFFLLTQLARKIPAIKERVIFKAKRQIDRMAEEISDKESE
jgi:NTP pyrophosphatase (non-canonical NTP hydrolase)